MAFITRGDPTCRKEDCSPFDLGVLFTDLKEFSNQRKYDVITNVWKPDGDFIFPQSKEGRRKRRFSPGWLKSFSWLVYSKYLDGAFCLPCAFFAKECGRNSNKLDKLVKSPLTFWTTAFQRLTSHSNGKCQTHNFSVVAMNNFIRSMRQEVVPIDQQLNTLRQQQIAKNREIISSILKTIIFCGRNNIPLRGRRDDDPTNESLQGNFQALLYFRIDSGDEVLQNHLENSSRNATYISKTIQNELITTVGKYILGGLSREIRESKYFSRQFCDYYRRDIPNVGGLEAELVMWERLWRDRQNGGVAADIPDRISEALAVVDQQAFCNIYTILQLLATVPISSATCERSISTLRYIKTYLRNSMTQDRLNGLALMYVHRDKHIDLDQVIELFVQMHPRRMQMADILQGNP